MSPRRHANPNPGPDLWTEALDWSAIDLETSLPPGHPTRLGRIVPSDRVAELSGRRIPIGGLLSVVDALALKVITTDREAEHWRIQLHHQRARTVRRYEYISAAEMTRRNVERQLAAGRNA